MTLLLSAFLHIFCDSQLRGAETFRLAESRCGIFLATECTNGLFVFHNRLALGTTLGTHAEDQLHSC